MKNSRKQYKTLYRASATFPVLLVTGPRQIGKTTMLNRIKEEGRKSVSLDNPTIRNLAKTDPELFLQRYQPPVLIDEIQYAPELFIYIKMYVDEKKENGLFWLTGSQAFEMMKNVTESLAGRVVIVHMNGLSNAEIQEEERGEFVVDFQSFMERLGRSRHQELNDIFARIQKVMRWRF